MIDGNLWVELRGGDVQYLTRTSTNDGALVVGIVVDDEYGLSSLPPLSGLAIDIGAHIGTVTLALATDHPDLRVIAVEPVPENMDVLRANVEANHLEDRITVVMAAAAAPETVTVPLTWNYRSAAREPEAYVRDSRYIAGIYEAVDADADTQDVTAVSLDSLMEGTERLALLKIDCEGCEWQFLRSPRIADVDLIIGEFHNAGGLDALRALLPSHDVTQTGGHADVGTFRAVPR
jgi:FkbM family methyltransferase